MTKCHWATYFFYDISVAKCVSVLVHVDTMLFDEQVSRKCVMLIRWPGWQQGRRRRANGGT